MGLVRECAYSWCKSRSCPLRKSILLYFVSCAFQVFRCYFRCQLQLKSLSMVCRFTTLVICILWWFLRVIHTAQICASVTPWCIWALQWDRVQGESKSHEATFCQHKSKMSMWTVWIAYEKYIITTEKATQCVFNWCSAGSYVSTNTGELRKRLFALYFKNMKILLWICRTFRMIAIF